MSGFDYNKEIRESIGDGAFKAGVLIGSGYFMGGSKPTLSATFKNFAMIGGIIAGADILYDYAKARKWVPWV